MVTERLQIRQIALLAMLTAMCVVLRIFKIIPIPNVQPVTDILMIVTLYLGIGSGITLAALTMLLSNIYLGFGIWTIPQILAYAGCVLTDLIVVSFYDFMSTHDYFYEFFDFIKPCPYRSSQASQK